MSRALIERWLVLAATVACWVYTLMIVVGWLK